MMLETGDFFAIEKGLYQMITHFGTAPFVWVYPIRELADISGLREMKTIKPGLRPWKSTLSTAKRSPFPVWEGKPGGTLILCCFIISILFHYSYFLW